MRQKDNPDYPILGFMGLVMKGTEFMATRRDRLNKRRENQLKTRAANSVRKTKERARRAAKAAAADE